MNDLCAEKGKKLFFNKSLLSDVSFKVEEGSIKAHKALVTSRCDVISTMFNGRFAESSHKEITIGDTSLPALLAYLEYLYTDHSPIESSDAVGILELANRFGTPRLVALCELYISKMVEKATAISVDKADIDVIGLLQFAQKCGANQLAAFCLHFISVNYGPMSKRSEWANLEGENLKYVEEHRWPPLSYLKEVEAYEKAIQKSGEDPKCAIM